MSWRSISLHLGLGLVFLIFLLPQVFLLVEAGNDPQGRPSFLSQSPDLAWGFLLDTVCLATAVIGLSLLFGFGAAYAVTRCEFPGRRLFSVLLCLPFAIPSFLLAGIMTSASYVNLVPDPRTFSGCVLLLAFSLYPWVYLPAKVVLIQQGRHFHEAGMTLGLNRWQRWRRIHLGLLLPAIGATALLVFMAVINDFGTTSLLSVSTLSVGIHDAMFSMYRRDWAAQLATIGVCLPLLATILFAIATRRHANHVPSNQAGPLPRHHLRSFKRWLMPIGLTLFLTPSLFLPVGLLGYWAIDSIAKEPLDELPGQILDTVSVTLAVTVLTLVFSLFILLLLRRQPALRWWSRASVLLTLNYAMPGVMLGIALLFASRQMPEGMAESLLSNSVGLLIIGACMAYLCFPFYTIRTGLSGIGPDIDDLCTTMGIKGTHRFLHIDLPLLKRAIAGGALLVGVNMAKELPISMVLHPFGFRSLSLGLYEDTGVDMVEESALYALVLIALLVWPIIALDRMITKDSHAGA